jgi:hypothetical protein
MTSNRLWLLIVLLAAALLVTELQWARTIGWDEVEYFRATRWVSEGRVPFRDFWEHHLPLQWALFAPVAAVAGEGVGVSPILAMRWAQLPVWIATLWFLFAILRRSAISAERAKLAIGLVLASVLFLETAVEYRLDAPAAAMYFGALLLVIARPRSRVGWLAFGVVMSAAVLTNMRLVPLVVATAVLLLVLRLDERRWAWNGVALWMAPGVALAAASFGGWVWLTGSYEALALAMRQNVLFVKLAGAEADTFGRVVLMPFTRPDPGAVALVLAGVAGALMALREIRKPGILQLLALLAIASFVFVSRQGVHYAYHFQIPMLLLAALAVSLLETERTTRVAACVILAILAFDLVRLFPIGESMTYKDAVMREADRRTLPSERVWDGCGYALHREPAYRYWFLPLVVRMLAERGAIERYDAPELAAAPPAAIIHSFRVNQWLRAFPAAGAFVTRHYVPLYRDLWIPAMNAVVPPAAEVSWRAPRAGPYRAYASELLTRHPWFTNPLSYAMYDREDAPVFEVPLRELPPAAVRVTVNGVPASGAFNLKLGDVVRVRSGSARPVGVVIVPEDVSRLFVCPPSPGWM